MLAKDLISDEVPFLKTSDTGMYAMHLMEIFRVSQLPIVNNKEFLGLIADTDILDMNEPEEAIGNHHLSLTKPFVTAYQHIYEVIDAMARMEISLVPVLDDNNHYLGVILANDIIKWLASLFSLKQPGCVLVLEVRNTDYSLTEIAKIIEENDTKILSLYISANKESDLLEVNIKINKVDPVSVIATFERYNYKVKAFYTESTELDDLYNERFKLLMRYLNT